MDFVTDSAFAAKRKKPWYIKVGRKILKKVDAVIAENSLVGDPAFFNTVEFDWIVPLEANWKAIRAELDEVMKGHAELPNFQDISEDQKRISQDDKWKTFFLYGYGYQMPENCARCPESTRLVEAVPGMKTAFFSILSAGKHIPPHRGPYKGVMRYHLGLMVPKPNKSCRIRVGSEFGVWQEGKSLLFDDTYEHEVWNDTEGTRVVLFMDVERPMRFPASLMNKAAFTLIQLSPFVQKARKNVKKFQVRQQQK